MLEIRNLEKTYGKEGLIVRALDNVSLQFQDKGMVFLLGKSGSGKSTMLNLIGGLDKADSGEIIVKGRNSKNFTQADFDSYRNTYIGFVFQDYNLLEEFTIKENIALSLKLQGLPSNDAAINEILSQVGLEKMGDRLPNTLSGGQMQRVAIARALIKNPEIIMADEPTGALDSKTGEAIFDMLKKLSEDKLVIVVSHDRDFAERYADRIIELSDGRVVADYTKGEYKPVEISENVKIVDGKTAVIKDVKAVNEQELKKILQIMSDGAKEAVIAVGGEEVKNVKDICGISDDGGKRVFSKTGKVTTKSYDGTQTQFIKSKLPMSDAIKMGASGLSTKPVRLIFTILLSVIAFCMFGVMSTLMLYSPAYTMSNLLQEKGYRSLVTDKNYNYVYDTIVIDETGKEILEKSESKSAKTLYSVSDIDDLNDNNVGLNFIGVYNFTNAATQSQAKNFTLPSLKFTTTYQEFYSVKTVFGFSDCGAEALLNTGAKLLAGRYPETTSETAITEYVYNLCKDSSSYNLSSPQDFIGQEIRLDCGGIIMDLTVTGIYSTSDLSEYYQYKEKPKTEAERKKRNEMISQLKANTEKSLETVMFVSSDFYEAKKNYYSISPDYADLPSDITVKGIALQAVSEPTNNVTDNTSLKTIYTKTAVEHYINSFVFYDYTGNMVDFDIEDNEIILPKKDFNELMSSYGAEGLRSVHYYLKNSDNRITELSIKGYYEISDGKSSPSKYILSDDVLYANGKVQEYRVYDRTTEYEKSGTLKYNYAVTLSSLSESQLEYVISTENDTYNGIMSKDYTSFFNGEVLDTIEQFKQIGIVAAVVVGIFAALMLLNFIAATISAKRKEIGVLRALGARGVDVFKIFMSEALILAGLCFIIAGILGYFVCLIINNNIYAVSGLVVLKYGFVNILLIFVIAMIISFAATFFPVLKEAKKPPVEGIRQL